MSDMSQGPGWWIASDGKWYPPESHPDVKASPEPTIVAPSPSPTAPRSTSDVESSVIATATAPVTVPAAIPVAGSGASTVLPRTPAVRGTRSKVPWVLGVGVLLALAVAALVVALTSNGGSAFAPGPETATINIKVPPSGQASFSGTVGGTALTGAVTGTSTGTGSGSFPSGGPLFTYQGNLGGTPYVLRVSLGTGSGGSAPQGGVVTFEVAGTYGSEQVTGNAEFVLTSTGAGRSQNVPFSGRVGSQIISGTATATEDGGGTIEVKAELNVLAPL